jgi:hypothetical protein
MPSPFLCSIVIVATVVYIASMYLNSFIEDMQTVQPFIITVNKKLKERVHSRILESEKSPLFKSLRMRVN